MRTRIGFATATIFEALVRGNGFGLDIMRETGLPSGTVYPTLSRAEASGLVRGKWEARRQADLEARPRRRYYELTAAGHTALAEALTRFRELAGGRRARSRS
jgi:DNA-binding PadR family transcriptional regulator